MQQLLGELDDEAAGMTDGMAALETQYLKDASEGMHRLSRLFDSAHESALLINKVVQRVNAIDGDLQATALTLHRAIILANQVGEIIKACQFAKTGTVNSNLLDHEEVETILNEVSNLPYQNAIEAIEFSRPSVVTNGTMILYILAFPKVTTESYKFMHSTISEGRQVVLEHNKLAASPDETRAPQTPLTLCCVSVSRRHIDGEFVQRKRSHAEMQCERSCESAPTTGIARVQRKHLYASTGGYLVLFLFLCLFYFFLGIQKRPAFFVGSRYGRSGSTTYDESLKSRRIFIVPRNEHFFLGSRYGKRGGKYLRLTRGINMLIVRKGFGNNGKERTLYLSYIIIHILMRNT
ncbi:LOW QUALITY PROTEIN: uncharacterized protein Dyak_GE27405 [Drosophila yakuba]|uniref:Uncharacterized protein n=1 Tax=Drosophila yakuba TaxID=7245 RepID=A0A0R1E8R1_DROYA|nr:LOW QUALITY PROTEIN: uncharacterized protein Dyak_GE27405 [Drosophila yakuba]